jgi:hypothetical protein
MVIDQRERLGRGGRLADDADRDPPKDLLDRVEPHWVGVADDSDLLTSLVHRKGRLPLWKTRSEGDNAVRVV